MNLNIIAYLIYIGITYYVTVHVGLICYRNGIHFIYQELADKALSEIVNRLLLTGYYLLNLGYAAFMIYYWEKVETTVELINSISFKTGGIILILGVMHWLNMSVIYVMRKKKTL